MINDGVDMSDVFGDFDIQKSVDSNDEICPQNQIDAAMNPHSGPRHVPQRLNHVPGLERNFRALKANNHVVMRIDAPKITKP